MSARWYRWDGTDLLLQLKLQPKASRDAFADEQHDRLRVRITAPPVDGKANTHLVAWLARQFGVAKSSVSIESGLCSPLKRVRVRSPARIPDIVKPPSRS
jgi:uncharacterized protein (TIGR00251 family)